MLAGRGYCSELTWSQWRARERVEQSGFDMRRFPNPVKRLIRYFATAFDDVFYIGVRGCFRVAEEH